MALSVRKENGEKIKEDDNIERLEHQIGLLGFKNSREMSKKTKGDYRGE